MDLTGRTCVVTGGASGIGAALAAALAEAGAAGVVVADRDEAGAQAVARRLGDAGLAVGCDVAVEADVRRLVAAAEEVFGPVAVYCSNAGVGRAGGIEAPDSEWDRAWRVNVLGHVHAARVLLPEWRARGEGHLVVTASAAGLLTQLGSAPYAVSKHAAVALAEWLAVTYGDSGVRVHCLCPMGVDTPLLRRDLAGDGAEGLAARVVVGSGAVLGAAEVAAAVLAVLGSDRFLVLPHAEVEEFVRRKAGDPDRWIAGMRRLQAKFDGQTTERDRT